MFNSLLFWTIWANGTLSYSRDTYRYMKALSQIPYLPIAIRTIPINHPPAPPLPPPHFGHMLGQLYVWVGWGAHLSIFTFILFLKQTAWHIKNSYTLSSGRDVLLPFQNTIQWKVRFVGHCSGNNRHLQQQLSPTSRRQPET